MLDKEISALEVRDKLSEQGYVFTPTFKKVKGEWQAKITVAENGRSVAKKDFETALRVLGWASGRDPFIHELSTVLAQEKNASEPKKAPKEPTPKSVQSERFRHPDADSKLISRSTKLDRELLSRFRYAYSGSNNGVDGKAVPVVRISFDDTSVWRVLNANDITSSLCSILTKVQPPKDWCDAQIEELIDKNRQRRIKELREELDEPPSDEELAKAVDETPEFQEAIEKLKDRFDELTSLLDYLNSQITDYLEEFSLKCRAKNMLVYEAADMWFKEAPVFLILSNKISVKYIPVETETRDGGTKTEKYFFDLSLQATWADLIESAKDWIATRREFYIEMPQTISNDPKTPCFHYVDLSLIPEQAKPTPAWDAFLQRMTEDEQDVFKAFVYSIYDAKNFGRQFIYFFDAGYSGKSCALSAIAEGLGKGLYASIGKESLNNQFGMSKVWDKRLVVYPDNKNKMLHKSQAFYNMTGHDLVDVEVKGAQSFSHVLCLKVIAAGNVRLKVNTDDRSEATRVIPINIKLTDDIIRHQKIALLDENGNIVRDRKGRPKFVGDSVWPEMLKTEIFDFVSKCRDSYERLCPTRRDIILPDSVLESLEEMRDTDMSDYEEIFHTHFEITGKDEDVVLLDTMRKVVRTVIDEEYKGQGLSWEGFTDFMRNSLSIDQPTQSRALNRRRAYLGLKELKNQELEDQF